MPNGPEKSLAVLNAAACALAIGDKAEARRYYQVALSMPNILWGRISVSPYAMWCPLRVSRPSFDTGTTHGIAGNAMSPTALTAGNLGFDQEPRRHAPDWNNGSLMAVEPGTGRVWNSTWDY